MVLTGLGLDLTKHDDFDFETYIDSVSDDEKPPELESDEVEVELKKRTS